MLLIEKVGKSDNEDDEMDVHPVRDRKRYF
jgi:hypothetical protein